MQFRIASVLVATCVAAVILGAFLFTPLMAAVFIAIALMAISPAIWITGIIFARGLLRGFFIGGVASGFIAHVVALYYLILVGFSSSNLGDSDTEARVWLLGIWSMPGVVAILGGGLGSWTQWAVTPPISGVNSGQTASCGQAIDGQPGNSATSIGIEHPLS